MKKLTTMLTLLVCLYAKPAIACFNSFDEVLKGSEYSSRQSFPVPRGHPMLMKSPDMIEGIERYKEAYEKGDYQYGINYGLYLVYDRQYEEAEKVFGKLANKHPAKYEAAANYGTILEVNGKTQEALKWIKKAIEIDPNSHDGSEWLHVAILESKLRGDKVVVGSKLTGIDFGKADAPEATVSEQELKRLQKHLYFQLNERITFIEAPDTYIAGLLFELGNATLQLGEKAHAQKIYSNAQKYGFGSPLLDARLASAIASPAPPADTSASDTHATALRVASLPEPAKEPEEKSNTLTWTLLGLGGLLIFTAGGFVGYLQRKAKRKDDPYRFYDK
jgi:tetratricopeptide (TPR) repeat protein